MSDQSFVGTDDIRGRFARAMSDMYKEEVPQYGTLLSLVADINAATLKDNPTLKETLVRHGELDRLDVERHGAIRLGTADELSTIRRIFAAMGMQPVGYYDLSVAGVPVHSTAFRPTSESALRRNPFRVFTSLLRLELISDATLRDKAAAILATRRIFTERALALVGLFESHGGLTSAQADEFVKEVRETFRWHNEATVDAETYRQLLGAHRLIADVVCFKGPHINHLTPRTLDIDAAQGEMPRRDIRAKDVVEGPPKRKQPILLRQTSFKALEEPITFVGSTGVTAGSHTARFGEIEQRGMALTRAGRTRYDELLASVRDIGAAGSSDAGYSTRLAEAFIAFPDDLKAIRRAKLAFFQYAVLDADTFLASARENAPWDLERLIDEGAVDAQPIVYEDFLPVSAAGIFQSNLGGTEQRSYNANAAKSEFEAALGASVLNEIVLYEKAQQASEATVRARYEQEAAK
jgi:uncharacterized glyoxalase superfamily metalloenzyme YdcJ